MTTYRSLMLAKNFVVGNKVIILHSVRVGVQPPPFLRAGIQPPCPNESLSRTKLNT